MNRNKCCSGCPLCYDSSKSLVARARLTGQETSEEKTRKLLRAATSLFSPSPRARKWWKDPGVPLKFDSPRDNFHYRSYREMELRQELYDLLHYERNLPTDADEAMLTQQAARFRSLLKEYWNLDS